MRASVSAIELASSCLKKPLISFKISVYVSLESSIVMLLQMFSHNSKISFKALVHFLHENCPKKRQSFWKSTQLI